MSMRLLGRCLLALGLMTALLTGSAVGAAPASLTGTVTSATGPLPGYDVTLLAAGSGAPVVLGTDTSAADGSFAIAYDSPADPAAVLYLQAVDTAGTTKRTLWSVLETGPVPSTAVVNEATTIATAYAMAQFTDGATISGPSPGLPNAALMAHNLADAVTGDLSPVLLSSPNGPDTDTLDRFDSLANAVTACLETELDCEALFDAATSPEGSRPDDAFEAMVHIAHDPWHNMDAVMAVTLLGSTPYQPALAVTPAGWTLALRFVGDGTSLDGPGNMAIDERGHLWVNINYTYSDDPNAVVCGSNLLDEFLPDGTLAPGAPHSGGGLDGAGFGIGRDIYGDIWVGNFGFASPDCPTPPLSNSVSQFHPDGTPVSPDTGWTQGDISWPQTTRSDASGNMWIANCGNDTVTMYPGGDPSKARNLSDLGIRQPFDIAVGNDGRIFVSGPANDAVAMLGPDGTPLPGSPITGPFRTPMGLAADSGGYVWVANQGALAPFCPDLVTNPGIPSLTLLGPDGTVQPGSPFTSGGIILPWGLAVDGNDNVWAADFGGFRVTQFCGVPTKNCRPGGAAGDHISPDVTGYGFGGLTRNTGVQIDPSGNVWLMNNWKTVPNVQGNPGGYEIVAFVGMAGPVQPAPAIPRPAPPTPAVITPAFTG